MPIPPGPGSTWRSSPVRPGGPQLHHRREDGRPVPELPGCLTGGVGVAGAARRGPRHGLLRRAGRHRAGAGVAAVPAARGELPGQRMRTGAIKAVNWVAPAGDLPRRDSQHGAGPRVGRGWAGSTRTTPTRRITVSAEAPARAARAMTITRRRPGPSSPARSAGPAGAAIAACSAPGDGLYLARSGRVPVAGDRRPVRAEEQLAPGPGGGGRAGARPDPVQRRAGRVRAASRQPYQGAGGGGGGAGSSGPGKDAPGSRAARAAPAAGTAVAGTGRRTGAAATPAAVPPPRAGAGPGSPPARGRARRERRERPDPNQLPDRVVPMRTLLVHMPGPETPTTFAPLV